MSPFHALVKDPSADSSTRDTRGGKPRNMTEITRFAPSPTGRLHLGHIYAALYAAELGKMQLRIEDIDHTRCREAYVEAIIQDMTLLGFAFPGPMRQSQRLDSYASALAQLRRADMIYPCFCTRSELALSAGHTKAGIYPGTCKRLSEQERHIRLARGEQHALRLNTAKAEKQIGRLTFTDLRKGTIEVDYTAMGDVVVARKELATSYHLACVVDDAAQGVSLVTRGEDLLHACHVQRLLQALLDLPEPRYCHHPLLTNNYGQRLAKRKGAVSFAQLLESGALSLPQLQHDFRRWFLAFSHRK